MPSIQELLDQAVAEARDGVVAAIGRHGEPVRYCVAGSADVAGTPLEPDDVFRVASITKTFVSVMLLQTVGEGALTLDTPVLDIVPEAPHSDGVTLRQLLNHSSGIPNVIGEDLFPEFYGSPLREWSPQELLALAAEEAPLAEPGKAHSYSNTNYIIAGLMLERVTGRSLAENLRERITEPLGLTQTAFPPDGPEPVTGFYGDELPGEGHTEGLELRAFESAAAGAGAMVSSAPDLVVFFGALGGGDLLTPDLMAEMTNWEFGGVGLGVFRAPLPSGEGIVGSGAIPDYLSAALVRHESGDVAVTLVNDDSIHVWALTEKVYEAW